MKVMSIVGTRPEIIKMSEIIKKLDRHTDHIFVHTGQNYDKQLKDVFFDDLGLRQPDYALTWAGNHLGAQLANMFYEVQAVLDKEKPDAVVILGDTNSALSGILVKRMKIPLFHLEAGNRCFDENVPEEINRRILDHIADVNMVYTQGQRLYLRDEGVAKDRIFVMGSPMKEVIFKNYKPTDILSRLGLEIPELQMRSEYYLVSIHRDENTEIPKNLEILTDTLAELAKSHTVIVSTHPRFKKKIGDLNIENVQFLKPFGFRDYLTLQKNAVCVISDSGTIAEESSVLGFPAITIRNAHERAEATDVGSIIMTGVDKENILKCLEVAERPTTIPADYDADNCSERVLKIILGYTGYVKRKVYAS